MEAFSLAIAFLVIFLTISFAAFRNASNVGANLLPGGSGWPVVGMDSIIQKQLKTDLEGKTEANIHPFSRSLTLTLACRFFLGIENPERIAKLVGQFDIVTDGIHSLPLNVPGTAFYYAVKAAEVIRKELADVVAEKKARVLGSGAPTQDLCTTMIVGGYMSDEEISEKLMGFLVAGYSTVATTMTFVTKFVGERPDVYHKILSGQKFPKISTLHTIDGFEVSATPTDFTTQTSHASSICMCISASASSNEVMAKLKDAGTIITNQTKRDIGDQWKSLLNEERQKYKDVAKVAKAELVKQQDLFRAEPKEVKRKLQNRISLKSIVGIVNKLSADQRSAVETIGLGGILQLRCTFLNHAL
ncbi:hypothetical protein RHMOL_Rhmol01G0265200 [Rhododendron molle]|uniref:Uncharacterized protein n=1 Tax=Rhododendron molle TaxID=49168 RepID=A0ACC0Q689_RHOML|nr:hypothetical protein RHMOL_Rhmol01G0265200 [Rhododendron molle]